MSGRSYSEYNNGGSSNSKSDLIYMGSDCDASEWVPSSQENPYEGKGKKGTLFLVFYIWINTLSFRISHS